MALVLYNHQSHNSNMLYMNMNAYEEYMEKRQLFLRSYQFCRKKSLTERMRASLFRVKRVIWLRLKNARRIRKLVWSRLRFICRRRRRFVRLMNQHNYYNNYYSTSNNNNNSSCFCYEAWVIYNFLSLCLAWVGGPGAVVLSLSGRVLKPSVCLMTCCLPPVPLDGRFIRRCKQGCVQFVILKPILVVATLILYANGKYKDGNFSPDQGYLYITIIYTISYTMALYALVLFYMACRDLLHPFNPVPKFIMIKSVVFLTYWQGVLVFLAAKSGLIENTDEAAKFQDFILCIEMLIAAVGHLFAFPYKEYAGANIGGSRGLTGSLAHALKLNDFYHDTVHQFAPTYHDYVLYNHNEGDEGTRKYRSRTFVPTGHEMDAVRRNKLDEIQLSSVSSSDASTPKHSSTMPDTAHSDGIKSSLLVDVSNSLSAPYDMALIDIDMSSYPAKVPAAKENETR